MKPILKLFTYSLIVNLATVSSIYCDGYHSEMKANRNSANEVVKDIKHNYKATISNINQVAKDEHKSVELSSKVYRINGKMDIYAIEANDRVAQMVMRKSMATYKSLMGLRDK